MKAKYKISALVIDIEQVEGEAVVIEEVEATNLEDAYSLFEEIVREVYPEDKYDLFYKKVLDVTSEEEKSFLEESKNTHKYIHNIEDIKADKDYVVETLGLGDREFNSSKSMIKYLENMTEELRSKTRIREVINK